jgi:peptide/nickel transport system substrate-binding protein
MRSNMGKFFAVMAILAVLIPGVAACGVTPGPAPTKAVEATSPPEPTKAPAASQTTVPAEPTKAPEATQAPAPTEAPTAEKTEPVTLRVGTDYIVDTLNAATSWYNYTLHDLTYDTLWEWSDYDAYRPGLAESFESSADGLTWTFHIREGVTFHDGTPFTAEAAAWTLNWIKEKEVPTMVGYLTHLQEAVAVDPTTLELHLDAPVGNLTTELLIFVWIMPPHVWQDMSDDQIMEDGDSMSIGTGPLKVVEFVPDETLELEANPDYWAGPLHFDRMIYQQYANMDAAVQALIAGEVDVVSLVPATAVDVLKEHSNITVIETPSFSIDELIINSHENGTQPAWLNDPTVRLAIAYGIDKQQIINAVWLGHAQPGLGVTPPSMGEWHNTAIQDIPYDPTEGSHLLAEAGYVDKDGDGIRETPDGKPMDLRLYAEEGSTQARTLEIISNGLKQMGINAPPTIMDTDSLVALYPDFDFDLIYWGWGEDPDPDFIMSVFTCDQREEGGWNDSGFCDPTFEDMYAQQAAETDHAKRVQLIHDMEQYLFDKRPYIVLVYENFLGAYRNDRFTGFIKQDGILWKNSLLQVRPVE